MECKFCGEKDRDRLFISVSAIHGRITSDIVMCFRCYWREKFEREKNENRISRQANAREIKGKLKRIERIGW